jgi:hypothetical protein
MSPAAKKTAAAKTPVIEGQTVEIIDEVAVWGQAPLNGRIITFNQPNPTQYMVMRRLARQLNAAKTDRDRFFLVAQFLDAVSALMIREEDRRYADTEVLEGRADLPELTPLLIAAIGGSETFDQWQTEGPEAKKAAPRRVRRARS